MITLTILCRDKSTRVVKLDPTKFQALSSNIERLAHELEGDNYLHHLWSY